MIVWYIEISFSTCETHNTNKQKKKDRKNEEDRNIEKMKQNNKNIAFLIV
jgi:hypothetical protein